MYGMFSSAILGCVGKPLGPGVGAIGANGANGISALDLTIARLKVGVSGIRKESVSWDSSMTYHGVLLLVGLGFSLVVGYRTCRYRQ